MTPPRITNDVLAHEIAAEIKGRLERIIDDANAGTIPYGNKNSDMICWSFAFDAIRNAINAAMRTSNPELRDVIEDRCPPMQLINACLAPVPVHPRPRHGEVDPMDVRARLFDAIDAHLTPATPPSDDTQKRICVAHAFGRAAQADPGEHVNELDTAQQPI